MIKVGQKVKVLEPFNIDFPLKYTVLERLDYEDGQVAFMLEEIGAFAPMYLEAV